MQQLFPAGPVFFFTASLFFHRFNRECDFSSTAKKTCRFSPAAWLLFIMKLSEVDN